MSGSGALSYGKLFVAAGMDILLKDDVAVVTGAAQGIGRAVARRMALSGAKVVIADIDLVGASQMAADIEAAGGAAFAVALDS